MYYLWAVINEHQTEQLTMVIDLATRQQIKNEDQTANLEIVGWNDPVMRGTIGSYGRVLIDGLVPLELAEQIKALCDDHNAKLATA